jgi:hypothetical protein
MTKPWPLVVFNVALALAVIGVLWWARIVRPRPWRWPWVTRGRWLTAEEDKEILYTRWRVEMAEAAKWRTRALDDEANGPTCADVAAALKELTDLRGEVAILRADHGRLTRENERLQREE